MFRNGGSGKMGTQVVVPYREEDEKRHLKPMGDLGQIVPMVCLPIVSSNINAHWVGRNGTFAVINKLQSA